MLHSEVRRGILEVAAEEADAERRKVEQDAAAKAEESAFWERYAREIESGAKEAEARLAAIQAEAVNETAHQLDRKQVSAIGSRGPA